MPCNFIVGQKVVRFGGREFYPWGEYPAMGQPVTIRAIDDHGCDRVLLRFREIDNSHMVGEYGSIEPGFCYQWFRPVVGSKTDITIFRRMLFPDLVDA